MEQALDKKAKLKSPVIDKAAPTKGGADVAQDKADIGAMLRPEKGEGAGQKIKVGAANDSAEKEADAVADAITKPQAKDDTPKPEGEEADSSGPMRPNIRGPPALPTPDLNSTTVKSDIVPLIRRVVADQNGSQPNTDALASVPTIDGKMAEVGVSASEEAEFENMSNNDFSVLSDGQNAIMMKSTAGATGQRADYLPDSLARLVQSPGQGSRLPVGLALRMQDMLGVDLRAIRVHTGPQAQILAAHVQARAFAYGADIFLRNPGDIADPHLMAHETAHCIQQGAARPLTRQAIQPQPRAPPATLRRFDEEGDDGWLERGAERLADRLDSYQLLKVLIGRRLFTGATVQQDAMSYVGAFMNFIGANETFEQMKDSGSLERGFQTIREGADRYNLNWPRVRDMFSRAYDDFEWTSPISSLSRIFSPFFSDLVNFGILILKVVAELVAEAFVIGFGPLGQEVWEKIKAIGEVIGLVLENPLGFAMNLLRSVALGIENFGYNILNHVKKGLLAWVLGPLAAMGVQLPETLDLKGIINVLLQVLGLTYPQLRPRIVRALNPRGEIKVTLVERLIEIINILRTDGIAGIWRKFLEYVENLQMTVINGIRDWVVRAVIQAGIRKLVAWSNPAGALLDILLTIYKLIVFFVEKFQQILSFASSIFESIGKIARGQLADAARAIENTLALTIPIMISFLTNLLGLPDIAGTVRNIIEQLRARVHAAVDKVLDFVIKKVKKLIARLIGAFKSDEGEPEGSVNMQGTQHTLAYEQVGRERKLYMNSEKTEVTNAKLTENKEKMEEHCTDPITSEAVPHIDAAAQLAQESEQHEARVARGPESNAASPDNNTKRAETLAQMAEKLSAGTDPNIRSTEAVRSGDEDVDDQSPQSTVQDGETVADDQKTNVEPDMEDMHFRYVIVPEESALEASWGPWSDMVAKRETFKTELQAQGLEGRYAVDLDHNPEYQILWRLGHLEYSDDQRNPGDETNTMTRMFPKISELYGHADLAQPESRTRRGSDRDFVMAIRYDAHRGLSNTQTANVDKFKSLCEYLPSRKAFVPKPGKMADLVSTAWGSPIDAAAQTHQSEVDAAYAKMFEDSFVSDETLADIRSKGPSMIDSAVSVVNGEAPALPEGEAAAGHLGGIGMRRDPVDAELVTGNYSTLASEITQRAPSYGSVFDKHHLVEKSILGVVRDNFTNANLLSALTSSGGTVAGQTVPGTGLGEVATNALQSITSRVPALAGMDTGAEQTTLLANDGFTPQTAFASGSVEAGGYAISVLKVTNGLLGSQSPDNVNTAVSATLGSRLEARASAMRQAITSEYASVSADEDAPPRPRKRRFHRRLRGSDRHCNRKRTIPSEQISWPRCRMCWTN
ncbi:DUF4157 domain-containing protein [Falsihalocynthiibacter arcticus]|uniref:eCIS core domain-containing protein n=1 Tax=Falsihalocynthiibacter arcticus TaxID=1579316 RepID=A0A126V1T7_9RHOB|nr:DUF4157 domain-containing protein [Falsihalocynthiibacter arcticus]AML51915.1 hypothetical protein RC74_12140 [Falsihalocynthiibacter arcticus]